MYTHEKKANGTAAKHHKLGIKHDKSIVKGSKKETSSKKISLRSSDTSYLEKANRMFSAIAMEVIAGPTTEKPNNNKMMLFSDESNRVSAHENKGEIKNKKRESEPNSIPAKNKKSKMDTNESGINKLIFTNLYEAHENPQPWLGKVAGSLYQIQMALISLGKKPKNVRELQEEIKRQTREGGEKILEEAEKQHQYTPY